MIFGAKIKTKHKKETPYFFRTLKTLLILILMGILYSVGIAVSENIQVDRALNKFKERSVFEEEVTIEYSSGNLQTRRYYKVPRETSYEVPEDNTSVFFYDSTRKLFRAKREIFLFSQEFTFSLFTTDTPLCFIIILEGTCSQLKQNE